MDHPPVWHHKPVESLGGTEGVGTTSHTFFPAGEAGEAGKLDLNRYIQSSLRITQGQGVGDPLRLFPWERRFLRGAFAPDVRTSALSISRGAGKSTLLAAAAAATVDGPLVQPRAETVVVASSFAQSRIIFEHVLAFLALAIQRDGDSKQGRWRIQDSVNTATLQDRRTGARVRCIASDPRRAHGLAPSLVLADEPAQWEPSKAEAMLAALKTGLGKIPGGRLIALGTRPGDDLHWFSKMLKPGGADYVQVHAARKDDPKFQRRTWDRANPSLPYMPALLKAIREEAETAKVDDAALASFEALRLNRGTGDTVQSVLIAADTWERVEGEAERLGRFSLGLDLGQNAAMSGASAYFPQSGLLDAFACFPELPSLAERGLADGVGNLYQRMHKEGDLLIAGRRVSEIPALLRECLKRWGRPAVISVDRWREAELRDHLESISFPLAELKVRGQGFKDGGADVRVFRRAILDGRVTPKMSVLIRSAMSEARVVTDPAANSKLAKQTQGGRRSRARDDVAAAAILAVAGGWRDTDQAPVRAWRSAGLAG